MILILLGAFTLGAVLVVVRRKRRANELLRSPLAGFDTGTRSPYRVQGRIFRNRRTL